MENKGLDWKDLCDVLVCISEMMERKGYRSEGIVFNPKGLWMNIWYGVHLKGKIIYRTSITLPRTMTDGEVKELAFFLDNVPSARSVKAKYIYSHRKEN